MKRLNTEEIQKILWKGRDVDKERGENWNKTRRNNME